MQGKGLLKGLGITIRHLFEKDITTQYPEETPFLQERFRGRLFQEFAKCIVCGICVKSCPNNVLSLEEGRDPQSKKKILLTFTIEHQYCMFCNICVENCPANCLHFNHDFELARYHREDIKTVYRRAEEMSEAVMEMPPEEEKQGLEDMLNVGDMASAQEAAVPEPQENKKNPAEAMLNALLKNPAKVLAKYLPDAEQAALVAAVLAKDAKKAGKVAELMVSDKDKAKKVIEAMLKTAAKAGAEAGEATGSADGGKNHEP